MTSNPYKDFNRLTAIITDEKFANVSLWEVVDDFESLKKLKKRECPFGEKGGIYLLTDVDGHVAYIGKAKFLYDRLSSHSKALGGTDKDKAPAWDQFFTYFADKKLTARYFIIDGFEEDIAEQVRQCLERAIQVKYRPYFDELYYRKKNRIDEKDFELQLSKIKSQKFSSDFS